MPERLSNAGAFEIHRDDNTGWFTFGERRVEAKSTIVLGGSTINYVDIRRMKSKGKNVFRKSFPGSSTEDMNLFRLGGLLSLYRPRDIL